MSEINRLNDVHLSEAQAEAYGAGRLSEQEVGCVEEHLLICGACRQAVDEAGEFLRIIRTALQRQRSEEATLSRLKNDPSFLKSYWLLPAAATAILALVISIPRIPPAVPAEVFLSSTRASVSSTAPAGRPLKLTLDLTGLPSVPERVQVVDASGTVTFRGSVQVSGGQATAGMRQKLSPGDYWVRLYDDRGALLREYGLRVR